MLALESVQFLIHRRLTLPVRLVISYSILKDLCYILAKEIFCVQSYHIDENIQVP